MAFIVNTKITSTARAVKPSLEKANKPKIPYQIPERYQNSFYLANAAFFDSTNWFLHRAYEVIFPALKNKLKTNRKSDNNAECLEDVINVLDQCSSVIDVRFPLKKDNGKYELIRGFRAQHGLRAGYTSCLGGLRVDENITRDHMKALSVLSTYRNACMGIGMAGAFGGIKINPRNYSCKQLKQIVQNYASELFQKGYCNNRDVLQPDINCDLQVMGWICEVNTKLSGKCLFLLFQTIPGVIKLLSTTGFQRFVPTKAKNCTCNGFLYSTN